MIDFTHSASTTEVISAATTDVTVVIIPTTDVIQPTDAGLTSIHATLIGIIAGMINENALNMLFAHNVNWIGM